MARIDFKLPANIWKMVVSATLLIIFATACNGNVQLISVYKADGSLQCQTDNLAVSLEKMQYSLIDKNIQVYKSYKSKDGLMHMQLCDAPTDNINIGAVPDNT